MKGGRVERMDRKRRRCGNLCEKFGEKKRKGRNFERI